MKLEILDTSANSLISMDDGSFLTPRVNPAQITANQNDYDVGKGVFFRLSTDADRTITGFAGGASGRQMIVLQTSAFYLTLSNQSGSSTAANRIATVDGKNLILAQNEMAAMIWDVTTSRWRGYKLLNTTILINDNSATAYVIKEAGNNYLVCDSTNGAELVTITPAASFGAGVTVTGMITANGGMTLGSGDNIVLSTTTGTKIATGTTQLLGFWNATPVDQPAHIADPTGGVVIDAESRTAIAAINAMLAETGLTAAA